VAPLSRQGPADQLETHSIDFPHASEKDLADDAMSDAMSILVDYSSRITRPLLSSVVGDKVVTSLPALILLAVCFTSVAALFLLWRPQQRQPTLSFPAAAKDRPTLPPSCQPQKLRNKRAFVTAAGEDYGYPHSPAGFIDVWRPQELPALVPPLATEAKETSTKNDIAEVYLDYAGAALPWQSQLVQIVRCHQRQVLANPHATGPAAARTARQMEQVKKRLLDLCDGHPGRWARLRRSTGAASATTTTALIDSDHEHAGYEILFTAGTTHAMQLVAERLAWQSPCAHCQRSSQVVYPVEAHTSLVGMRGPALARGARFQAIATEQLVRDLSSSTPPTWLPPAVTCPYCPVQVPNLLAMPLECNFGGNRIPFMQSWVTDHLSQPGRPWWSLLDIAKASSTGPVSLRQLNPDFACLSFYKIFGSPTGLGCLFVKRSILEAWGGRAAEDCYYGGGAVDLLLPRQNITLPRASPSPLAALASGTCHFLGICELAHGLDVVEGLGGMAAIRRHTMCLASELVRRLRSLQHANGKAVVELYGGWADDDPALAETTNNPDSKGPTVAFNLRRQDESYVGYNEVAKLAALNRPCPIQLRVGCFCNPGACQQALGLSDDRILDNHRKTGHVCGDDIDIIDEWPTGAVRASFGKDSIWEDLDALVTFIEHFVATGSKLETSWDGSPRQVLVEEQYVFPIKSCAAQRVPEWQMDLASSRLAFDREFALVDSSGTAMRLQKYPKMAFIEPSVVLGTNMMTVRAPDMPPLEVSLDQPDEPAYGEGVVKVCGNKCGGILWGDMAVSEWFSDFLQVQCWLARFSEGSYELPPGKPTQLRDRNVAFANEQPLLLISKHAVDLLNEVLESRDEMHVTSRHFRPNFVVRLEGEQHQKFAHAEDGWKRVELQDQKASFDVVGQCGRCSMVDVDPRSGMKGHTLRALSDYRRQNGQISFGIFLKGSARSDGGEPIRVREGDVFNCE
jgi:molybdenum cofactor sulfurtransferase